MFEVQKYVKTAKKILVIDDEVLIRNLLKQQLLQSGFEVLLAQDGLDGLEIAQEQKPDLIILDVMMPGMNGFEVCARVRQMPELANVPVIFLTASLTRENRQRVFAVGANDYVVKPFQSAELLAHITAVLRHKSPCADKIGRVVALFGAAPGVGTTTVAIQLSRAMAFQDGGPVVLLDLDLPLGSIAPRLSLYHAPNIVALLNHKPNALTPELIGAHMQQYRAGLAVIPTPGRLISGNEKPRSDTLTALLKHLRAAGYQVVIDLGAALNRLSLTALRQTDVSYVITSGEARANRQHDRFMATAVRLGLDAQRLLPVVNELHGPTPMQLTSKPLAHIAHANEHARAMLWLQDKGVQKLLAALTP